MRSKKRFEVSYLIFLLLLIVAILIFLEFNILLSPEPESLCDIDSSYCSSVELPGFETVIVENPDLETNSDFGEPLAILDFDGDGSNDIATSGNNKLYVFYGPNFNDFVKGICPESCSSSMANAGNIDGFIGEDLVIGANDASAAGVNGGGKGYMVSRTSDGLIRFTSFHANSPIENERLGSAVAFGDFDSDGFFEIALGGKERIVFFDLALQEEFSIYDPRHPNDQLSKSFGYRMASQHDSNGQTKALIASSSTPYSNDETDGVVYIYNTPISQSSSPITIINPLIEQDSVDKTRFGMWIAANDDSVLIGAPRQDIINQVGELFPTAGAGFFYKSPGYDEINSRVFLRTDYGQMLQNNFIGYRVFFANILGDENKEIFITSLGDGEIRRHAVYSSQNLNSAPALIIPLSESSTHYPNGIAVGQLSPGEYEEIIFGDPFLMGIVEE